jgi:predicted restriction endonuclease
MKTWVRFLLKIISIQTLPTSQQITETSSSNNKGINKKRKERKTGQLENFLIW